MITGTVTFKEGVLPIRVLAPAGVRILGALDAVARAEGLRLVVSCADDGHPLTDPHSTGEAFDVSVAGLTEAQIERMHEALRQILPRALFYVQYETPTTPSPELQAIAVVNPEASGPHFHLQRKKGTVYPPLELPVGSLSA